MGSLANAILEFVGTPMFVAKSGKSLTLGNVLSRLFFKGDGSVCLLDSNPANGTAATTVAGSGTIDTTLPWQRVTNAGAITGVILESGTTHGQLCLVSVDKDASGSVTMAAAATSHVATGVSCVIGVGGARLFIWDATDAIWAEVGA